MNVYILSDMEGTAGVAAWEQVTAGRPKYDAARRPLTEEINAAAAGAFAAGAVRVVVNDGHGTEENLDLALLDSRIELLTGPGKGMWAGMDGSFGAFFQIGAHARAGTPQANLRHIWDSADWASLRINGRVMGEIGLFAAGAGELGVPCTLITGDDKACAEAAATIPGVVTATVKTGLDWQRAEPAAPQAACELIREQAEQAVKAANDIAPLRVGGPPVTVEILRLGGPCGEYDASRFEAEELATRPLVVQQGTAPTVPRALEEAMAAEAHPFHGGWPIAS